VNVVDLFSCIGGHALGLDMQFEVTDFVEINPQRRAFLSAKFPGVAVAADVRDFHPSTRGGLLVGGPPRQRTSVAAAIHGYRSGESLWPEMLRVARELAPDWIVVEQPAGNAAWETQVATDLVRAGYFAARVEFAACDLGAPHIRRRVFILANRCFERLEVAWSAVPSQIERIKRSALAGNHWIKGPPGALRVADGVSEWLDRNSAVEAIGDSNPPQMMTVIGRAILAAA
jgi:DNA (cytosine-5)-methyltransferase 1